MRRLTKENNIVLIFDEVITGFRMGLGGAQTFLGVKPDITTFAKAMANGFPIATVAAMKQFMEPVASERTWVAGTFSGNPVSASAALATISELESKGDTKIRERGREVMKGISEALAKSDLPAVVQGPGQMWSVIFTDQEKIVFTREIAAIPMHPHIRRLVVFFQEMVRRGIIFQPSRYGRMYFSSAHDQSDVEKTIQSAQEALREAEKNSLVVESRSWYTHSYLTSSPQIKAKMFQDLGISDINDLLKVIPEDLRFTGKLDFPDSKSEWEVKSEIQLNSR